jgi:hypothetical protein
LLHGENAIVEQSVAGVARLKKRLSDNRICVAATRPSISTCCFAFLGIRDCTAPGDSLTANAKLSKTPNLVSVPAAMNGGPPLPVVVVALRGAGCFGQAGGSPNKLPRYYDGSVLLLEYIRNRTAEVRTAADGSIQSVDPLFASFQWQELIQARISPSGVLHVAQFGANSTVYRLNYVGNETP